MCLSYKTNEPPEAVIVAPLLPDRASVFSVCFPEEVPDYDLPMDLGNDTDGVTLPNTYMDEMDMIDTSRILDTAPCGPYYDFDILGVSMIDSNNVTLYDACTLAMDMIDIGHILDASSPRPRFAFDVFGILCLSLMVMDLLLLILLTIMFLLRVRSTLWTYLFLSTLCSGLSPALMTFLLVIMT